MKQDGFSQRELCSLASSDPNTIRAMLLLMEKKGLLLREPSKDDGRALKVLVTKAGRDLYRKLSKAVEPLQGKLAGLFSQEESQCLIEYLDRISRTMDQPD
jgi:DNA-binding MarR family transcriptional regulator